jgi:hypothetical protein
MYPKDDQFSLLVQNVFSRIPAANEKNPPRKSLEEMLVQNVFSWAAAATERKPPSKSLQRNARREEFKMTWFQTHFSLYFHSLLCFSLL